MSELHPSHYWIEEEENDFRYFMCGECYTCSCCVPSGRVSECPGEAVFGD